MTPTGTEPASEELLAAETDLRAVTLESIGQLIMQTGTAAPVQLTIRTAGTSR